MIVWRAWRRVGSEKSSVVEPKSGRLDFLRLLRCWRFFSSVSLEEPVNNTCSHQKPDCNELPDAWLTTRPLLLHTVERHDVRGNVVWNVNVVSIRKSSKSSCDKDEGEKSDDPVAHGSKDSVRCDYLEGKLQVWMKWEEQMRKRLERRDSKICSIQSDRWEDKPWNENR